MHLYGGSYLFVKEPDMKLKNIGNKIISVGTTVILPGETKDVTGYDDNDIVKFFIGQGNLSEVKSRTAAKEK